MRSKGKIFSLFSNRIKSGVRHKRVLDAGRVLSAVFTLILAIGLLFSCGKTADEHSADGSGISEHYEVRQAYPLQVHFINVGHGDSALVQCEGHNMLIDGGLRRCGHELRRYLRQAGVNRLEAVVCSHEHKDHVGGLITIVHSLPYDNVYAPSDYYGGNKDFNKLVSMVRSHGHEITVLQAGDSFYLGGAVVNVLGPILDYGGSERREDNHSLVMRVDYGEHSFLFTGDIYAQAELDLMDSGADLESTVLKVPHHGSSSSSGEAFLQAVNPRYAVISTAGTERNHPHSEILSRLDRLHIRSYRTDRDGDVVFCGDKRDLKVYCGRREDGEQ